MVGVAGHPQEGETLPPRSHVGPRTWLMMRSSVCTEDRGAAAGASERWQIQGGYRVGSVAFGMPECYE